MTDYVTYKSKTYNRWWRARRILKFSVVAVVQYRYSVLSIISYSSRTVLIAELYFLYLGSIVISNCFLRALRFINKIPKRTTFHVHQLNWNYIRLKNINLALWISSWHRTILSKGERYHDLRNQYNSKIPFVKYRLAFCKKNWKYLLKWHWISIKKSFSHT